MQWSMFWSLMGFAVQNLACFPMINLACFLWKKTNYLLWKKKWHTCTMEICSVPWFLQGNLTATGDIWLAFSWENWLAFSVKTWLFLCGNLACFLWRLACFLWRNLSGFLSGDLACFLWRNSAFVYLEIWAVTALCTMHSLPNFVSGCVQGLRLTIRHTVLWSSENS